MIFSSLIRAALQQSRCAVAAILITVLAGCGKDEIKVYRVAKEKPETQAVANLKGGNSHRNQNAVMSDESTPTKPTWTVPAGWTEEQPSRMSLANLSVTYQEARAQMTVSAFPGDVGGLLANVNRWRGQVGLPPINQAELPNEIVRLGTQAGKANLVDLTGTDAMTGRETRLICAVLPHGDETWFFKIMGDEQVVTREKDAFLKFVQSAKFPDVP